MKWTVIIVILLILVLIVLMIRPSYRNLGPAPGHDTETTLLAMNDILSSRLVATADITNAQPVPLWWGERWRYSERVAADVVVAVDCRLARPAAASGDSVLVTLSSTRGVVARRSVAAGTESLLHVTVVVSHVIAEQESLQLRVLGPVADGTMVATAFPRFR